ncbi:amino acid permease ScVBA-like protein [Macrolepiota fuliginosa MF-IS2]|uniref:Amino acid permease ScVBA-like protein n=1 Tax=Macrolepiota fuliginosa MF-IS2 TaxID=1400762 RepID=A0A9P5XMQ2_9AGAR|nr:amino acid permease ScVBA-like protein [Macrolepiota fuliginosa MF-IS2]
MSKSLAPKTSSAPLDISPPSFDTNNATNSVGVASNADGHPKPLPARKDSSDSSCSSISTASSATLDSVHTEIQTLSTLRLLMTHIGAALALFLATTDATIVSTSLPTIASELGASQNQYTWVGVSYMLTQTTLQPLYGRISDLVGRKNVLFCSIAIFAIGSLLCGAAQSINWLIVARALAGIGGGGIVSAVWILTAEIVEVQYRAKWSQALSVTWSCSAIAGPLIGGIFSGEDVSSKANWRWGFYINLPICFIAFVVLVLSLRGVQLIRPNNVSWGALAKKFDFGGLILFMAGTSCIVVGFSFANEAGWLAVSTLLPISLGFVVLLCGGMYEKYTTRECLFPPTMFTDRTTVIILIISFLHQVTFTSGTFYLALFYQAANGSTPLEAGLKMLPYSLGSSLASMPAAWFIGYWQKKTSDTSGQKWIIAGGLLISTIGFGVLNLLDENAPIHAQVIYPLIAGIGIGMLFHAPYQVFTRALKPKELATGTSAFFLVRFTGATIGLATAGTIFFARAASRLPPEVTTQGSLASINYSSIRQLQPPELRDRVLRVISTSIQTVWTVWAPCLGLAFLLAFALRTMSIHDGSRETKDHRTSVSQSAARKTGKEEA